MENNQSKKDNNDLNTGLSFSGLLRNAIINNCLPLMLVFSMVLFATYFMSGTKRFGIYDLNDTLDTRTYYERGYNYVEFEPGEIFNAGYDYYVDDEKRGSYYFIFEGTDIRLLVLLDETAEELKNGTRTKVRVKLIEDPVAAELFEKDLSVVLGAEQENVAGFVDTIIYNQPEYPYLKIDFLYYSRNVSMVAIILTALYMIFALLMPQFSFEASRLRKLGGACSVRKLLDEDFQKGLLYNDGERYITENYLVIYSNKNIDVIRLDDISCLSKYQVEIKHFGRSTGKYYYRFSGSNNGKIFFDEILYDEDAVNDMIYYIRRDDLDAEEDTSSDDQNEDKKVSDEVKASSGEAKPSSGAEKDTSDEEKKTPDEEKKTSVEEKKASDEEKKTSDEEKKASDEEKKISDDERKASSADIKASEDERNDSDKEDKTSAEEDKSSVKEDKASDDAGKNSKDADKSSNIISDEELDKILAEIRESQEKNRN